MTDDPEIIMSRHNGRFGRNAIPVEVCVCRLEHTRWSLDHGRSRAMAGPVKRNGAAKQAASAGRLLNE